MVRPTAVLALPLALLSALAAASPAAASPVVASPVAITAPTESQLETMGLPANFTGLDLLQNKEMRRVLLGIGNGTSESERVATFMQGGMEAIIAEQTKNLMAFPPSFSEWVRCGFLPCILGARSEGTGPDSVEARSLDHEIPKHALCCFFTFGILCPHADCKVRKRPDERAQLRTILARDSCRRSADYV